MSERCAARVYTGPGAGVSGYPCQRPGKYQENNGWWCANHAPSRIKARQEKANAAFEQRYQAETAARVQAQARAAEQARRAACYDVLLAACEAALATCPTCYSPIPGYRDIRAAIARAKEGA